MMTYLKRKVRLLALGLPLLVAGSCDLDEFIGLEPEDVILSTRFFRTEADMVNSTSALYDRLQGIYGTGTTGMTSWGEMRSDNSTFLYNLGSRAAAPTEAIDLITIGSGPSVTSANTQSNGAYNNLFTAIRDANVILARIDNPEIVFASEAVRRRTAGEALFIRSLMYFELARTFGGVPIVVKEYTDASLLDELLNLPRVSQDSVYKQIISDADSAYNLLWTKQQTLMGTFEGTSNNAGRATKGAAAMLSAKAYLELAARTPVGADRTARYNKVIEKLDLLETLGGYGIITDFKQIFNPATAVTNLESVFTVQWSATIDDEDGDHAQDLGMPGGTNTFLRSGGLSPLRDAITNQPVYPANQGGIGSNWNVGTPDLGLNGWAATDLRKNASIFLWHYPSTPSGSPSNRNLTVGSRQTAYIDPTTPTAPSGLSYTASDSVIVLDRKFKHTYTVNNQAGEDFPVLRYSDAVLMRAEALAELGQFAAATTQLNRTRTTHGGLAPLATISDRLAFLTALLQERRSELAWENQRWYDLVRITKVAGDWKTAFAIDVMNAHKVDMMAWTANMTAPVNDKYSQAYNVEPRDLLLPIPLNEIIRNEAMTEADQNCGYAGAPAC